MSELRRVDEVTWEVPVGARAGMRVPARVFTDAEGIELIQADRSLEQLENVAMLPGVVDAVLAMPDVHQGYGFPVGGVCATGPPDGVISPGGVGYDINCGVRLLALDVGEAELGRRRERLVHEISRSVPTGAGREGGAVAHDRAARPRAAGRLAGAARPPRDRHGRRRRADGVRGRARRRRSGDGVRARPCARPRASWARWARATTSSSSSGSSGSWTRTSRARSGCARAS